MGIIIDVIVVGLIASFALIGYKQGIVKTAIKLVSFVIALIVAFTLYKPVSNLIINNTDIDTKIENLISGNIQLEEQSNEVSSISSTISNKIIVGTNKTVNDIAKVFTVKIINISVIIILYIVCRIGIVFISSLTELITNIPVLKQINELAGLAFGFLKGIFIVFVLLGVIYLITPVMPGLQKIIADTIVTKLIYENNYLLALIF